MNRQVKKAATVTRRIALPAEDAWLIVTDVRNHARWIPWTRIHTPGPLRVGDLFVAASGPEWLPGGGFVDRMVVERLDPPSADGRPSQKPAPEPAPPAAHPPIGVPPDDDSPAPGTGVAVFRKLGPVLLGTADVHVRVSGPDTCDVTWLERGHLRGLPPGLTAAPLRGGLTAMTRVALRRFATEVQSNEWS